MHPNPRKIAPLIVVLVLAAAVLWYLGGERAAADSGTLTASGTIEAVEITISSEFGGRVLAVNFAEGDAVNAGDVLLAFDTSLLEAQQNQAQAALAVARGGEAAARASLTAAQANAAAMEANLKAMEAGPTPEELAVGQTQVEKAQIAVDAAQETYEDLPDSGRETSQGKNLKQQLDMARANLATAQAQFDVLKVGARNEQIEAVRAQASGAQAQVQAAQAQVDIAVAQVEAAEAAISVLDIQIGKLTMTAPVGGVVLAGGVHPGEFALPGAPLMFIGKLDQLTMTVYVPEDRYGMINLGQAAHVTVDSFPGEEFPATVIHIAGRAEFTPRNVQTAEGRRTTVFAVKLAVASAAGKLKPGMPADARFGN